MEGKHRVMVFALCLAVFIVKDASTFNHTTAAPKSTTTRTNISASTTTPTSTNTSSSTTAPTSTSTSKPTSTSTTTSTTSSTTAPASSSTTAPTSSSTTAHASSSTTAPTSSSTTAPASSSTTAPTSTSTTAPTSSSTTEPISSSTTAPTSSSTTEPTSTSTTAPTTSSSTTAPASSSTTAPASSSTTAPTSSSTTAPASSSTTAPTSTFTTAPTSTNKYPSHEPDQTNLSIPLAIVVKANFSPELSNKSSRIYKEYYNAFNLWLTDFYQNMTGFISVDIAGFVNGSIRCNFNLNVETTPSFNVQAINNTLRKKEYGSLPVEVDKTPLKIDDNKTRTAMEHAITEAFREPCRSFHVECSDDTFCEVDTGKFMCSHKCNTNNICSNNGECFVDTRGTVKCRCREDSMYVYKGDTCKEKVMVFFSGKNTAIIGGSAGAVIACLLLLLIFLGARWRQNRIVKSPDEKLSDPEEIRRDNLQIENVPMDGFGRTNPMFRPDNSGHHDEGHDYTNPGNRTNRDNVYEDELAYTEGRYYRVLKDPESRSKAYVYQPSNMSIPEQRTSTASKFDELDYKPLSHHLRPEKEQQSFHDMVDTEQPYSIRRPQIMRTTVNANGYR